MAPTAIYNGGHRDLKVDARNLIKSVVEASDDLRGFGSLSCTVYDTAWVALVKKEVNGGMQWLFPESFHYIVASQCDDGSWCYGSRAQFDGVLNTMAGLLVLKRYDKEALQMVIDSRDLQDRIMRATAALRIRLEEWDISKTSNVGFEIIVPAMLYLLEQEDASFQFHFEGHAPLMEIHRAKMARFHPELLYGGRLMTLTHSLEALVGKIDFNKLTQHKVRGAMFASPSSTAAYLDNTTVWDDEAEAYLRYSIQASAGLGSGGVPGVFLTIFFEYTWVTFLPHL